MHVLRRFFIVCIAYCFLALTALAADPLSVGSLWEGTRTFDNKKAQHWTFKITSRKEDKFKGELFLTIPDGSKTVTIIGQLPKNGDGPIRFKSESKGEFFQVFRGDVKGKEISLIFSGTGFNGKEVSGTAVLCPKATQAELARYANESRRLSPAELEKRIRSNPRKTPDDLARYGLDARTLFDLTGTTRLPSDLAQEARIRDAENEKIRQAQEDERRERLRREKEELQEEIRRRNRD